MTPEEIREILKKHQAWLNDEKGGERADLRNASLQNADLFGVDLTNADLRNADLRNANLHEVDLRNANLLGADLTNADLQNADLRGADLQNADLRGANLRNAALWYACLTNAEFSEEVPFVPQLDSKILSAITTGGSLDMSVWHTCETTHCRAGWAVVLAGDAGKALEEKYGPAAAGSLIYARATGRVPDFYTDNDEALEDIRQCAVKETAK